MTRLAVISDIHSNFDALQAVAAQLPQQSVDHIICLGDVVGYGAEPKACLDWVFTHCEFCLMGNHEMMVTVSKSDWAVSPDVGRAIAWTRKALAERELKRLCQLPLVQRFQNVFFVHGSPWEPQAFHYIYTPAEAALSFRFFEAQNAFFGHTHVPTLFEAFLSGGVRQHPLAERMPLNPGKRYLINAGSIGQPRNRDDRAQYLIYDDEKNEITRHRITYDIAGAQQKILRAGLPKRFADRLSQGL